MINGGSQFGIPRLGFPDVESNDLGANAIGSNDIGSNDLGSNDKRPKTQQLVKRRRVKSATKGQNFIWTIFWVILTICMLIRTSSRSSRPPSLSALVLSPEISELNLTLK